MVRFDTNPERFASVNMLKKLESSIKESIRLDAQILAMDEEILLNPVILYFMLFVLFRFSITFFIRLKIKQNHTPFFHLFF